MGPLVYYCRWQGAKLRLRGRDERNIWGDLVFSNGESDQVIAFRFNNHSWELAIGEGDDQRILKLDELGVPTPIDDRQPPMTSVAVEP